MARVQIRLPPKIKQVFRLPRGELRFRGAFGGAVVGGAIGYAAYELGK